VTIKETLRIKNVPLDLIDRPSEPDRLSIDPEHIRDLAASIIEVGLLSPIDLCPRGDRYEIISGDCRYQAFLSLGRTEIPAFVKVVDAETLSVVRATENLQRRDLSVIEEGRIYKNLHVNHGMTWEDIARRTGKSVSLVKRRCDLLKMPEMLINAMHERKIGYAVAEELMDLKDLGKIEYYLGFCIDHGATRDVVRNWVKEEKSVERQRRCASEGGEWGTALPEIKPYYVACDLCQSAVEIGKEIVMRVCPECYATIKANI